MVSPCSPLRGADLQQESLAVIKRCPRCDAKLYLEALYKESACPDCGSALRMEGFETTMALSLAIPGAVSMIATLFMGPGAALLFTVVSGIATITFGGRYVVEVRVAEPDMD